MSCLYQRVRHNAIGTVVAAGMVSRGILCMRRLVLGFCFLLLLAGCTVMTGSTGEQPAAATATEHGTAESPLLERTNEVPGAVETEFLLTTLVTYLSFFAELCGVIVIGVATFRGFLRYVPHMFGLKRDESTYPEDIRLRLGKSLALALEFELGADILRTAVAPTLSAIGVVAAIVALRTLLNFFLEREIRHAEQRESQAMAQGDAAPGHERA